MTTITKLDLIKHLEIFNPQQVLGTVAVIGVGAVGSAVALNIAKLGVTDIMLFDADIVVPHNLTNQILYGPTAIGQPKVQVAANCIQQLTGYLPNCYQKNLIKLPQANYSFICVDSMAARQQLFASSLTLTEWLIDGRMAARHGMVFAFDPRDPVQRKQYQEELYSDDLVKQDRAACGVVLSIGATVQALAALMTWNFIDRVMRRKVANEIFVEFSPHWRTLNERYYKTALDV